MDCTNESSGSGTGSHGGKNADNSDKGNEKEHEVRATEKEREPERERERLKEGERSIDSAGSRDDDAAARSALLKKLGAGLAVGGSGSSSHQSSRLMKIVAGLRAGGEEGKQVEALTQLCLILSIGTEDTLSTLIPVDSLVPLLAGLLIHESNADIMLLAARALTHLVDVLPSSCTAVVQHGAVSCFVAKLLAIEYMDLAEQSLQALKNISLQHPTACLRAGALMAVLSYLDFFSTGVQRVALSTAANMCRRLPSDAADFVMEAVPLLTNLLDQYRDAKVLEHASVCLTRIAAAFSSSPDKLEELCNHGLVTQAASLISTSSNAGGGLSTCTHTALIKLLSICASGSHLGAKTLLLLGISGILKDVLSLAGVPVSRPPEQVFEIVNLANALLPPLPQGAGSTSVKLEDGVSRREKLLLQQPELVQRFAMDLLPVVVQIYGSSVNGPVRYKCLSVIGKLMYLSSADMIQSLLSVTNVSSFLAGVLACKDPQVLVPALQIAEILMEKLAGTFSKTFIREGVVHAIDALIVAADSSQQHSTVSARAKVFKEKYFLSNPEVRDTDDLLHLKNLCWKLNAGDEHKTEEDSLAGVVAGILAELGNGDGVSTFEFTGSGVVKALLRYFTCGHYSKDKVSEANLSKLRQHALRRYKSFVSVALSSEADAAVPMNVLIQKLQSALSSLERFPVVLTHNPSGSSSGLSVLAQPLKLRLCRAHGEQSLRDYSANVVLIDPLTSLAAVESFLWTHVQPSESGQKPQGSAGNTDVGTTPRLRFSAGGKQLNRHSTIYEAIQTQLVFEEDDDERYGGGSSDRSRLWTGVYTITYQKADENTNPPKSGKASSSAAVSSESPVSLLDSILQGELPCDLEKTDPTYDILALLRVLEVLNQLAPRLRVTDDGSGGGVKVPAEEFINNKLAPKLARQIQDPLALCSGSLPSWCSQLTRSCPFLFPFETRRQFFYSTAFGLSRALNRLQQQQQQQQGADGNEREVRVGRLQRRKVRVSRSRILDSAVKVMEMYSSRKAVLEVEYFGEVGTGLGPTLEFYTLLSHDLQKSKLGMWISTASSSSETSSMEIDSLPADVDLVHAPLGLFPRPWAPNVDASEFHKVVEYFRLLGRVMAKALQDGRLMDLPLSSAFYKLVLGQALDLEDIASFDAAFGKTLQELQALVSRKRSDLLFRGSSIEDLCLDFTLPGHPEYVLKQGGENVKMDNLGEYLSLVVDATVRSGIRRQMEAFRAGFNQVFDVSSLRIFSPDELDYLLCGRRELWKADTLADHVKFDHGYTAESPAVVNLLEIMGELNPEQQRAFCRFVTGAPRLPPGGLAALNPKLTIVRKRSDSADEELPSVMTCANYLKLPSYSTKEIMFNKLLYAIKEGQGSFDLS